MKCKGGECKKFLQEYGDYLHNTDIVSVDCKDGICKLRTKYEEYVCQNGKCKKVDNEAKLAYKQWIKKRDNFDMLLEEAQPESNTKIKSYSDGFR